MKAFQLSEYKVSSLIKKDTNLTVLTVMFTAVVIALAVLLGDVFYSVNNFQSMAFQISEFGFLAIAMSLSMITGGIDLSIVSNAGLSAVIGAFIMSGKWAFISGMDPVAIIILAVVVTLITSTLCGTFNGILIATLGVPPILATLGTMILFSGIGMALTNGESIGIVVRGFTKIGSSTLFEIPVIFILLAVVVIVVAFILAKTKFGKLIYLLGENSVSLRFSGINTEKLTIKLYTLIGFIVGLASIIMSSRINSARMGFGDTYQLQTILVAVLGGINPDGGKGKILGVVIGMILLQFLQSAFTIFGFTPYAKKLIFGAMLLLVMIINFYLSRERKVKKEKKQSKTIEA